MKKKIAHLDAQIGQWKQIVSGFPLSEAYKGILSKLEQERTDLVSKIGKREKRG